MVGQEQMVERSDADRAHGSAHVIARADRTVLAQILRPGINLAIWRRGVPSPVAAWLATSSAGELAGTAQDVELGVPAACVPASLSAKIAAPTRDQRSGIAALAQDAGDLANLMAKLTGMPFVRVRVEWVRDQPCPYFHTDKVPFRLVCTYRGAGTQWLSNNVAERLRAPDDVPAESQVNCLTTGDVAVMRGSSHSKESGVPLTHRSPPLDFPLEWRLFLAIDPAHPDSRPQ
jgi:Protein of unknown function (DUF1826)